MSGRGDATTWVVGVLLSGAGGLARLAIALSCRGMELLTLALVGVFSATLGSLIGAGGGFVLVPMLLFLLPGRTPGEITALSLAATLATSVTATLAFIPQGRVRYRWGVTLAFGSVLGGAVGAFVVQYLSRDLFQGIFGIVLVLVSLYILVRPVRRALAASALAREAPVRPVTGIAVGAIAGFAAGLMGIGGGIITTPAIVYLYSFAPHIATATSQFTIIFTSISALGVRFAALDLNGIALEAGALVTGAIVGGRIGPALSRRFAGPWLMRILAISLGLVGVRLTTALLS